MPTPSTRRRPASRPGRHVRDVTSGTVNLISLATFKAYITAAIGTTGGVIHLDDVTGPVTDTQIDA